MTCRGKKKKAEVQIANIAPSTERGNNATKTLACKHMFSRLATQETHETKSFYAVGNFPKAFVKARETHYWLALLLEVTMFYDAVSRLAQPKKRTYVGVKVDHDQLRVRIAHNEWLVQVLLRHAINALGPVRVYINLIPAGQKGPVNILSTTFPLPYCFDELLRSGRGSDKRHVSLPI